MCKEAASVQNIGGDEVWRREDAFLIGTRAGLPLTAYYDINTVKRTNNAGIEFI